MRYQKTFSIVLLSISLWFMHFGPYNNIALRSLLDIYQDKVRTYQEIKSEFDVLTKFRFQDNDEDLDAETTAGILKQIGAYLSGEATVIND